MDDDGDTIITSWSGFFFFFRVTVLPSLFRRRDANFITSAARMKKKKTRISRVQPRATVYHAVVNYWNSNEKGNWSSRIKYTPLHVCTYYGVLGGRLVIIMSPHERIGVCTCTNLLHRCGIRRTCGPASRRSRVRLSLNRKTCKKMKKKWD